MKKVIVALMCVCGIANAGAPLEGARFELQATYGDCKVGLMRWTINRDSAWYRVDYVAQAIICPGVPTTSITYREGKHDVTQVIVQPHEETSAEKAARLAKAKAAALSKLSLEERKALGL